MKILNADQFKKLDAYTIENEPISSVDLMERAARECSKWISSSERPWNEQKANSHGSPFFHILSGNGNNGGDGLAIARLLAENGYEVNVSIVHFGSVASDDFNINLERLKKTSAEVASWKQGTEIEGTQQNAIIVDALFGTGLNRPPEGLAAEAILWINEQHTTVISIDLPSGLFPESSSRNHSDSVVKASYTLSFQNPKLAFFLTENEEFVGQIHLLDIGLDESFLASMPCKYHMITAEMASSFLINRSKFSHKGTAGHVLILGGSKGKWGAPILSARGALRGGAGLVTVHTGSEGTPYIHASQSELMVSSDSAETHISDLPNISSFNSVAIGPGLGTNDESKRVLKALIQESSLPLILDADALNILADNPTWLSFLPQGSILTPHPGEFSRIVGQKLNHFDGLSRQLDLSRKNGVYIILKGGHTSISTPDGNLFINSSGNPGMSTAGMGDALTGILAALMAGGYGSLRASILGVFVHGMAGDLALEKQSHESLITQDLIEHLGPAFKVLRNV